MNKFLGKLYLIPTFLSRENKDEVSLFNLKTIYDRGIAKKREMEQKISMIKKTKEKNEVVECTFAPNIKDTEELFNKNRPNFFNQEDK